MRTSKQLGNRAVITSLMLVTVFLLALFALNGAQRGSSTDALSTALQRGGTPEGILAIVGFALLGFCGLLGLTLRADLRLLSEATDRESAEADADRAVTTPTA